MTGRAYCLREARRLLKLVTIGRESCWGHDSVAGGLVKGGTEPAKRGSEDVHKLRNDGGPGLNVELFLQLHRAVDIGKEDSYLLALR